MASSPTDFPLFHCFIQHQQERFLILRTHAHASTQAHANTHANASTCTRKHTGDESK